MDNMKNVEQICDKLVGELCNIFGDKIDEIILYGSAARGDND